jgi:PleD family two-component response regulator
MNPRLPVEEGIAIADMALIRAKELGRNRVELWTD